MNTTELVYYFVAMCDLFHVIWLRVYLHFGVILVIHLIFPCPCQTKALVPSSQASNSEANCHRRHNNSLTVD
jgi:hypothetical protein